jgi:autotransporter strand-loop-strand O-heptosyltransferase
MKILMILPHVSTGGMPQVALKRVEALINIHDVYVIEYREIAWSFVVQRNKLKNILGNKFISLGWTDKEEIRDHFQEIVEKINPDIVHMEEIPEKFIFGMRKEHADWLYRKDRPYKIVETTHTSTFDIYHKIYFPDKFIFVSEYSKKEYSKFNIPSSVIEYPIEELEKNQGQARKILNFDPNYFHILNVGLFTKDKNQAYLFEIAEKLKEYKINFHFVGNLAENFSDSWKPLMEKKLTNCYVYGEREDVDLFYQASDLLIHPSLLELNPLAIKEATSYDLPIFLNKLSTYLNMYDNYKNIKFLSMDIDIDIQLILDNFNIKKLDENLYYTKVLSDEYINLLGNIEEENIEENIEEENKLEIKDDDYIDYSISFIDGAKVEINGKSSLKFGVDIFDKNTNELIYYTQLGVNNWCATNNKCYKEYRIHIKLQDKIIATQDFDLTNKNVLIQLDSRSIGDTLAWFPYVEEFRKKHNCKVFCSTFWNNWFIEQYPEIVFLEPGTNIKDKDIYAKYNIGWYLPIDQNRNPIDYKKIPLQKTASDILGLDYKEIVPKINIPDGSRPIEDKYICIAQFSTANAKHWHYPCKDSNIGWQLIVDWLNEQGYKVMVISKQKTNLKNIIDRTGNFPIEHRINELKHCEFFIGVGSGLSWLAWATGKKVVMISGFSNPICEFQSNIINVHNFNVCNGCFNKHIFDRGDWNWCPEHKDTDRQFECTTNITPKMITDRIIASKLIENQKDFDFEKYTKDFKLNVDDIKISYAKENNKIMISYNGEDTPQLNIDLMDFNTKKIYHTITDVILSKRYVIWAVPKEKLTNKIIISFYQKNKILDLEFEL